MSRRDKAETWHRAGRLAVLLVSAAVWVAAGCGSSGSEGTATRAEGTIAGTIDPAATRAGGVMVQVDELEQLAAPADADGAFEVRNVHVGEHTLAAFRQEGGLGATLQVRVGQGRTTHVGMVRLVETGLVAGVVRAADGSGETRPIAGARVTARPVEDEGDHGTGEPADSLFPVRCTATRADGAYLLRALRPGDYEVSVERNGYQTQTRIITVQAQQTAKADFTLEVDSQSPLGSLMGVAYGPDLEDPTAGEVPLQGAVVRAWPAALPQPAFSTAAPFAASMAARRHGEWVAVTNHEGVYRLSLPAGDYRLLAARPGYSPTIGEVNIPAAETVQHDFHLSLWPGLLAGQVFATGEENTIPVAGARVTLGRYWPEPLETESASSRAPGSFFSTQTDAEGHYRLEGIPTGWHVLVVRAEGYLPAVQPVLILPDSENQLDVELQAGENQEPIRERLQLRLEVDGSHHGRGQTIRMRVTLRNQSGADVQWQGPANLFDVVVTRAGEEVWRWTGDQVFTAVMRRYQLRAGDTMGQGITWRQRGMNGQPVAPGEYQCHALASVGGQELQSDPVALFID